MNKTVLLSSKTVISLLLAVFLFCPAAQAADMWTKAGRGLNNIVFSPLEIFYRPYEMRQKGDRWPIALAGGVFKGAGYAVARLGVGVFEVLTFPHPCPGNYETILEPEHMFISN